MLYENMTFMCSKEHWEGQLPLNHHVQRIEQMLQGCSELQIYARAYSVAIGRSPNHKGIDQFQELSPDVKR